MVLQEYLYFLKRKPNVLVANGAAPSCKKTKQNLPYYIYALGGRTLATTGNLKTFDGLSVAPENSKKFKLI